MYYLLTIKTKKPHFIVLHFTSSKKFASELQTHSSKALEKSYFKRKYDKRIISNIQKLRSLRFISFSYQLCQCSLFRKKQINNTHTRTHTPIHAYVRLYTTN